MSALLKAAVYTIEVANRGNSPHVFAPTKDRLLARWHFSHVMHRNLSSDAVGFRRLAQEFPDGIPGECVQLNTETFVGRIFSPMTMAGEGELMAAKLRSIYKANTAVLGPPPSFRDPVEYHLDADGMKHWLWAISQMIVTKVARFVAGSDTDLPTIAQIRKLPGKLPNDPFNQGRQDGTGREGDDRPQRYRDSEKVPAGYGRNVE